MNKYQINDRVEYVARLKYNLDEKHKVDGRRCCVGFVKRIFRKWFVTYVEICECHTRRVDCVKLSDVFGKVAKDEYKSKSNRMNHGIKSNSYSGSAH